MLVGVYNQTRKKWLHKEAKTATNIFQHSFGFMFQRPNNRAILFKFDPPRKILLHMWFVFGSIDVLCIDEGKVIALKEQFKPWTFWDAGCIAPAVIELSSGTIARTRTKVGDKIALRDHS